MASSSLPRPSIQSSALESGSGAASLLFRGTGGAGARTLEVDGRRVRANETTEVELRSWGCASVALLYGGGRPSGSWEETLEVGVGVVCGDSFDLFAVGVRGVGSTELAVVDCDDWRLNLVRADDGGDRGIAVST